MVCLVLGMGFLSSSAWGTVLVLEENPKLMVERLQAERPQHILYLHFDRNEFVSGDTLWFKAYLANAANHVPIPDEHRINIEMINVQNQVVRVVFVQAKNGIASGYMALPVSLPGGNHLIRAYTDWMKNFDTELYFSREIFVVNTSETYYSHPRQSRMNRSFNKRLDDLANQWQVAFFPEGGQILLGVENRIAFRATDGLGNDIVVSGEIFGRDRSAISTFETDIPGYGDFFFSPTSARGYHAVVRNAAGQKQRIALPGPVQRGYTISASIQQDSVVVLVRTNFDTKNPQTPYYLLAISGRGMEYYQKIAFNAGSYTTSLPLADLHTGVLHWVLLDASSKPLAERSQFINNLDFSVVDMRVFPLAVQPKDGFEVNINLELGSKFQGQGSFSLSITSVGPDAELTKNASNLASEFLLSGNLRFQPNRVWDYLSAYTALSRRKLDLIMLTNRWLRMDAQTLASEQIPGINFPASSFFRISGKIESPERIPLRNPADVILQLQGDVIRQFSTTSDTEGYFSFANVALTGVVSAEITATARHLPGASKIRLMPITALTVEYPISPLTRHHVSEKGVRRSPERVLPDFTLSAITRLTKDEARGGASLATPDQVIYVRDLMVQQFRTVFDVLRTHASGFNVSGGRVLLRGPTTLRGSSEPMFGIDGMFTSRDHLLNMRTTDVERIEIFKGPSASIFGVRGAAGVIMVHTRTGTDLPEVSAQYLLTGFQPERTFLGPGKQAGVEFTPAKTTLKWMPDVRPDSNGKATLWVRFNSKPMGIRLVFQGLDSQGNLFQGEEIVYF